MPPTDPLECKDPKQEQSVEQQPSEPVAEDSVRQTSRKNHTKVSLAGELGPSVVESLRERMIALSGEDKDIVIDCAKAEHLPASALQVLLAAQAALANGKRTVRIESESPRIRDYLNLAGLNGHFPPKAERARRKRCPRSAD